ncbi:slc38a2 [Symbiodinium sp. CCMP2592]|nr:slc38a2 [Symbiodinium sp. CCMP2592]
MVCCWVYLMITAACFRSSTAKGGGPGWDDSLLSQCPHTDSMVYSDYGTLSGGFPVDTKVPSTDFADTSFTMIASLYVFEPVPGGWTCWLGSGQTWPFVNSGHLHLCLTNTKLKLGFYSNDLDANYAFPAETWATVSAVYDASSQTQRLYVDGALVGTRSTSGNFKGQATHNVEIGRAHNNPTSFDGKGAIRNVVLYTEAIDAADLEACAADPWMTITSSTSSTHTLTSTTSATMSTSSTSSSSATRSSTSSSSTVSTSSTASSSTSSTTRSLTSSSSLSTSSSTRTLTSSSTVSTLTTSTDTSSSTRSFTSSSSSSSISMTASSTVTTSSQANVTFFVENTQDQALADAAEVLLDASLQHIGALVTVPGLGRTSASSFSVEGLVPATPRYVVGQLDKSLLAAFPFPLVNHSADDLFLSFSDFEEVLQEGEVVRLVSGRRAQLLADAVDVSVVFPGGQHWPINVSMQQPIYIRVAPTLNGNNSLCAFLTESGWSMEGVRPALPEELAAAMGDEYLPGFWCATTHLTIFAAILELAVACTNIEVLSSQLLPRLLESSWPTRAPSVLVLCTLGCCVVILLAAILADRRARLRDVWRQSNLLTAIPPSRVSCCPSLCRCPGKSSHAGKAPQQSESKEAADSPGLQQQIGRMLGSLQPRTWARRTGIRVMVRGTLQSLALLLWVDEHSLQTHVWNGQGWVQGSLVLAKSKLLAKWTANLDEACLWLHLSRLTFLVITPCLRCFDVVVVRDYAADGDDFMTSGSYKNSGTLVFQRAECSMARQELPRLYAAWGRRRWRRALVSFAACHPFLGIFPVSVHLTSAKRAMIFSHFLLGSLAMSSLFISVTGVLDVTSDFDCPVEDDTLRLLLIAAVSMALNSLPRLFFRQLGSRYFAEGAGDEFKVRRKLKEWLVADALFWLLSFLWQAGYILFLCAFLASLAPADESKCLLCFGAILFAKFIASPFSRMLGRAWKGIQHHSRGVTLQ